LDADEAPRCNDAMISPCRDLTTYHCVGELQPQVTIVGGSRNSLENGSTNPCEIASEQGKNLKGYMHDTTTMERLWYARMNSGTRPLRGRFSVCLFIVVLAVFGWVVHRRLTQYDAPQQAIHQSTAIKVTVTKRNPISVPSQRATDAIALFLLAFAFALSFNSAGNTAAAIAYRVQRDQSDQHADVGMRPCLDHFLLLPPPSLLSEL
jgi:hypothetical protein